MEDKKVKDEEIQKKKMSESEQRRKEALARKPLRILTRRGVMLI